MDPQAFSPPKAKDGGSRLPAQTRVQSTSPAFFLTEAQFQPAIIASYFCPRNFHFELTHAETAHLLGLFKQEAETVAAAHQAGALAHARETAHFNGQRPSSANQAGSASADVRPEPAGHENSRKREAADKKAKGAKQDDKAPQTAVVQNGHEHSRKHEAATKPAKDAKQDDRAPQPPVVQNGHEHSRKHEAATKPAKGAKQDEVAPQPAIVQNGHGQTAASSHAADDSADVVIVEAPNPGKSDKPLEPQDKAAAKARRSAERTARKLARAEKKAKKSAKAAASQKPPAAPSIPAHAGPATIQAAAGEAAEQGARNGQCPKELLPNGSLATTLDAIFAEATEPGASQPSKAPKPVAAPIAAEPGQTVDGPGSTGPAAPSRTPPAAIMPPPAQAAPQGDREPGQKAVPIPAGPLAKLPPLPAGTPPPPLPAGEPPASPTSAQAPTPGLVYLCPPFQEHRRYMTGPRFPVLYMSISNFNVRAIHKTCMAMERCSFPSIITNTIAQLAPLKQCTLNVLALRSYLMKQLIVMPLESLPAVMVTVQRFVS